MYIRNSRRSVQSASAIKHFVAGATASAAAQIVGVHRNTAASFITRLRKLIAKQMEKASPFAGEVVKSP